MVKVCEKHGVEYVKSWRYYICPECRKETNKRYQQKHVKQRKAWRATEAGKESQRKYDRSPKRKAARKRSLCNTKVLARKAVLRAIKAGILVRPAICSECNNPAKIEAHHHLGYEKEHQLDVLWLCKSCHLAIHKQ